ncbi:TetR/AcrR family transcriptional regulator [Nocardia abscessus]|uniref:TetR/AcrR family transcriptional regulator n=1 Tax=Nocardia abscessus TaxID=120957 RepID=UPI002455FB39|nr:TetR/AcrR family transcriptional regulator [Nocardia abscessus]
MTDELPPVARLLWSGQRTSGRGPRPALTVDGIVTEAIAVADADGIEALSMQRVAKQVGAATMSLYRHVPNKDALISLMLDAAMKAPPALPFGDWRLAIEQWARAMRELYSRHPWVLAVGTGNRYMGPNEAAWGEAATRALLDGGLALNLVTETLLSVSAFTAGVARLELDPTKPRNFPGHAGPVLDPELMIEFGGVERFPALMSVTTEGTQDRSAAHAAGAAAAVFEFGLTALIDGVANRMEE